MTHQELSAGLDRRQMIGAGLGVLGGAAAISALTASSADAAANDATFWTLGPTRVVDSRTGLRTTQGKIRGGQTRTIDFSTYFLPGYFVTVIVNLTVTGTERSGYLTIWENGLNRPATSNVNWWGAGQTYGNLGIVGLRSSDVTFQVYCGSSANSATHVIVDLLGYYYRTGAVKVRPPVERR